MEILIVKSISIKSPDADHNGGVLGTHTWCVSVQTLYFMTGEQPDSAFNNEI